MAPRMNDKAANRIERSLAISLLRGTFAPGSRLPTFRELAVQFGANLATVQRAVARLETTGLVQTRQGSGIRANDPHQVGDLSLVPLWLLAFRDRPVRAARILADFLEVRRLLAARLMVRHRTKILEGLGALAQSAQALSGAGDADLDAIRDADIAFARILMRATGNTLAMAVVNKAERLLVEVPEVAAAMYASPEDNIRCMVTVLQLLAQDTSEGELGIQVEAEIEGIDRQTVQRFEALLLAQLA